jgi:ubiquinone/menaquinone biosynthesis C-methylase UbiE
MGVRAAFDGFYRAMRGIIAPNLVYSQATYEEALVQHVGEQRDWMDLGCGHRLLPEWRFAQEQQLAGRARMLVGFDYDIDALQKHKTITHRVRGDVAKLPFQSQTFEFISSNMVFEHLKEPDVQLRELHRVLRPGGTLIFHTPNKWGYGVIFARLFPDWIKRHTARFFQGRPPEDVYPAYYRINSEREIRALAAGAGLRVKELQLTNSVPTFIMLPPVVVIELLWLRVLMTSAFRRWRTNIICVLEKPG